MGLGKLTLLCDQGATFRVEARWRQPLMDLASGDPILDVDGNVLAGPPMTLNGYTGRMHVRKTVASTTYDLDLTTANGGVLINQPNAFVIGWCRLATEEDHPLTGLDPVDGITPVEEDRILVKSQYVSADDGVYAASAGAWLRAEDADEAGNLSEGCCVWVREGRYYDDTTWRQSQALTALGTDPQDWQRNDTIGVFRLYASDTRTSELTTSGVYDVEMISPGGDVTRVLEGKFRLSKEVTRT